MSYKISSYIHIKKSKIHKDNKLVYRQDKTIELNLLLKDAYIALNVSYPKFHKMDGLSKLGILGTHVLLGEKELQADTALVFSNSAGSLETDKIHGESMKTIVSPAVFVYTLPNIVLGEISIKYNVQGENMFFVSEGFDASLIYEYSCLLLDSLKTSAVVCGWIEWKNADYDVFLCLISQEGALPFSEENLKKLYAIDNE